jgi:hypothetical protein
MEALFHPAWLPDGSAVVFTFNNTTEGYAGIGRWTAATGARETIYKTPKDMSVGTLAVGADGDIVFELVTPGAQEKKDLYLLDKAGKTAALTTTGDSGSPGW